MNAERNGFRDWLAECFLFWQALFVQRVAGLVKHAEERVDERALLVVARRDARVARPDAGAERMYGNVQPTGVKVEADRFGAALCERFEAIAGEFSFEHFNRRALAG